MTVDPLLVLDAEQMRLLRDSSAWPVLQRYLENLRDEALRMAMQASVSDQEMHHWRGVYAGTVRALNLPEEVIAYEAARRSA